MKIVDKAFNDIIWPIITKSFIGIGSREVWISCFKNAATSMGIHSETAKLLAEQPSLQRLMINTFKPDRHVPSALDFALSIAFEKIYAEEAYSFNLTNNQIRSFAVAARGEWMTTIIESPMLRVRFKEVRDKHPSFFIESDASCLPEIEKILESRNAIEQAYFNSYATKDATEFISVWLPDKEGVVNYDHNKNCTIVAINTAIGADRGFFRIGYDYSLNGKHEPKFLSVCYFNEKKLLEIAEFSGCPIKIKRNHVIWIR